MMTEPAEQFPFVELDPAVGVLSLAFFYFLLGHKWPLMVPAEKVFYFVNASGIPSGIKAISPG